MFKVISTTALLIWAGAASAGTQVIGSTSVLLDGPGATARPVQTMAVGTKVDVLERYQGYGLVRLASGVVGWTKNGAIISAAAYAKRARPAAAVSSKLSPKPVDKHLAVVWPGNGNLNLRSGPGLNSPVTMVVPRGDWVEVSQMAGPWARVRCMTGEEGWVHSAYLRK